MGKPIIHSPSRWYLFSLKKPFYIRSKWTYNFCISPKFYRNYSFRCQLAFTIWEK